MQSKSKAIPFLNAPPALDGSMPGDVGFDPLWVSSMLPDKGWLPWLREAEIKHGRVAMLAATGMIVQDIAVIPGFDKEFSGAAMMKLHNLAVQQVISFGLWPPSHPRVMERNAGTLTNSASCRAGML